MLAGVPR